MIVKDQWHTHFESFEAYYKLKLNILLHLFNDMLPHLSIRSTKYVLRCSSFQLPMVKHGFAKRGLQYNIVKIINTIHNDILDNSHTHSLYGYAYYIKYNFLQKTILMSVQYEIVMYVIVYHNILCIFNCIKLLKCSICYYIYCTNA